MVQIHQLSQGRGPPCGTGPLLALILFFLTLVTGPRRSLSLNLSDTRVHAPQIRAGLGFGVLGGKAQVIRCGVCARLGTTARACQVLELADYRHVDMLGVWYRSVNFHGVVDLGLIRWSYGFLHPSHPTRREDALFWDRPRATCNQGYYTKTNTGFELSTWTRRMAHRGTSLIRNCTPLGPYSRPIPRALWWP